MSDESRDTVSMVLQALSTTEPDPEMQSRILAVLLQKDISHAKRQTLWQLPWFWSTGLSLATAAILSVIAVRHANRVPADIKLFQAARADARSWSEPDPTSSSTMAAANPTPKHAPVPVQWHRVAHMLPAAREAAQQGSKVTNLMPESFPAPPMPLTRQERLLLRMLRGGDAGELFATLSVPARNATDRADREQYNYFFYDAPTQPHPELAPAITAQGATLMPHAKATNLPTNIEEKR